MGTVTDISTRQAFKPEDPVAQARVLVFECSICHAKDQLFKLATNGDITCGDCGVTVSNLEVKYKEKKHGA